MKARAWLVIVGSGMFGFAMHSIAQGEDAVILAEVGRVVGAIREGHDEARAALQKLPRERFETGPVLEASDKEAAADHWWVEVRFNEGWSAVDPLPVD